MTLTFPRAPIVELFLNGWREVQQDVRQGTSITITQGGKDEATKAVPCKCELVLDDGPEHGDGDYNPENPTGPWYELLTRNTPLRVALRVGRDDCARIVASGWGTSPELGAYTAFGADSSVASGEARHSVNGTNTFRMNYLNDLTVKNVDVAVDVTINGVAAVTGAALEPANIVLRGISTGQYYMLRVSISTAGVVSVAVHATGGALSSTITVPGLVYSGQKLRVRFQAEDNTFRGKVWAAASVEPLAWHIEYSHGDVWDAGWLGIRSGVASGNTNALPIVFRYDNIDVRIPRFSGESAKLLPTSTVDNTNRQTQVTATGILRRLSQGSNPLKTALYRFFLSTAMPVTMTDYWPLDDQPQSQVLGTSPTGSPPPKVVPSAVYPNVVGGVTWGVTAGPLAIERCVKLYACNMRFFVKTELYTTGSFGYAWMHKRSNAKNIVTCRLDNGDSLITELFADGSYQVRINSGGLGPVLFAVPAPDSISDDGEWHYIAISATNVAGTINLTFVVDGVARTATQAGALNAPVSVAFQTDEFGGLDPINIAQMVMFKENVATGGAWVPILNAQLGWPGEEAGTRFNRLCTEEGASHAMVGYPTVTPVMGPQRPLTLLALVQECIDVDLGGLFEARGNASLVMRTNRSLIRQTPGVTLDYANQEIAPVFRPVRDDQATVNDVTAKKPDGGEHRRQRLTGPMNVANPGSSPGAVGRYAVPWPANTDTDAGLIDVAGWRLHLGTTDEARSPTINVNLRADAISGDPVLTRQLLDLSFGDGATVINGQNAYLFDDYRQVVRGWVETLDDAYRHAIAFNTTPASAYDGAALGTGARLGSDTSTAGSFLAGTDTLMSVTTTGGTIWTTTGPFPFNIKVGGVVLTVTNITGAGAGQSFTITAAPVNGVVKLIPAGSRLTLATRHYLTP